MEDPDADTHNGAGAIKICLLTKDKQVRVKTGKQSNSGKQVKGKRQKNQNPRNREGT